MRHLAVALVTSLLVTRVLAQAPDAGALDEFASDDAVNHAELNPSWAACQRAKVLQEQRDNFVACRAQATAKIDALVANAQTVTAMCTPTAPLEVERARQEEAQAQARVQSLQGLATSAPATDALKAQLEAAVEKLKLSSAAYVTARKFEAARSALDDAVDTLLIDGASPRDFQAYLADSRRQNACAKFSDAVFAAYAGEPKASELTGEAADAAAQAHASDILRKGSNVPTSLTDLTAILENPGAPDAVTFSLMSALGASEDTSGTQAVLTLNLAQALTPQRDRSKDPAALRNLFLRAQLPLRSTEAQTSAVGGGDGAQDTTNAVNRFQFVLGTSLLDQSDTRLSEHRPCYRKVVDYLPTPASDRTETNLKAMRAPLFDVCSSIAAHEQRLALRGGIGLVTSGSGDDAKTKAEVYALTAVWGPTPWLYFNALYQRIVEPGKVHNAGAGLSLGGNVGGGASGVDAWARVTLNALWVLSWQDGDSDPVLQTRLAPTVLTKLGDAIAVFSLGPTITGSNKDTGLLATIALTYDADALITPLLNPVGGK